MDKYGILKISETINKSVNLIGNQNVGFSCHDEK